MLCHYHRLWRRLNNSEHSTDSTEGKQRKPVKQLVIEDIRKLKGPNWRIILIRRKRLQKKKSACSLKNVNIVSEFRCVIKKEIILLVVFAIDASLKDQPLGLFSTIKGH